MRVQHEERQAAEVIAMEVGNQDRVDPVAIDAAPFQRGQGRSAAVDQLLARGR